MHCLNLGLSRFSLSAEPHIDWTPGSQSHILINAWRLLLHVFNLPFQLQLQPWEQPPSWGPSSWEQASWTSRPFQPFRTWWLWWERLLPLCDCWCCVMRCCKVKEKKMELCYNLNHPKEMTRMLSPPSRAQSKMKTWWQRWARTMVESVGMRVVEVRMPRGMRVVTLLLVGGLLSILGGMEMEPFLVGGLLLDGGGGVSMFLRGGGV